MSDYLIHYGVKGMKWGVRKEPRRSDHVSYRQKKAFKSFKKQYLKDRDSSRPYIISDNQHRAINDQVRNLATAEDVKRIKAAKDKWLKMERETPSFYDSKEFQAADKKAYSDTMSWFKKERPDYLNQIVKMNKGKTSDLDKYHDFRKTLDGYKDYNWSKAEKAWNVKNGQNRRKVDQAWKEYKRACEDVGNRILGDYGNAKIGLSKYDPSYNSVINDNIDWDDIIK